MTSVQVPGKLYIAGEYAVLRPGGAAVLIAVDKFLTVDARECAPGQQTVTSEHTGGTPVSVADPLPALRFVASAVSVVTEYAQHIGCGTAGFDIQITSGLDDAETGRKYGLGSSGAVTAGVVQALAALYLPDLDPETALKLALLAVFDADPRGSGGDVATSLLCSRGEASVSDRPTGWVGYRSPDRDRIAQWRTSIPVADLVERDWPLLHAHTVPAPRQLEVAVGWTGRPADSAEYVGSLRSAVEPQRFAEFGEVSNACVDRLVAALHSGDDPAVAAAIDESGRLLRTLAHDSGVQIETPQLAALRRVAEGLGLVAKSSGAGGGDCGIALVGPRGRAQLERRWLEAGVQPLDIRVGGSEDAQRPS